MSFQKDIFTNIKNLTIIRFMNVNDIKSRLEDKSHEFDTEIGYVTLPLIILSQRLLTEIANLLDEKYNLSNSELDVLASLNSASDEEYTLTPTRLYERLFLSSGGMTKVLKKLEKKGFIQRLDNKDDKRSKLVQLTKSGSEILEVSLADVIKFEENFFTATDTNERKMLSDLLFKVLHSNE